MKDKSNLKICYKCPITHFDNCGTCYGFGVHPGKEIMPIPISAIKAIEKRYPNNWYACPECGSTPEGIPDKDTRSKITLQIFLFEAVIRPQEQPICAKMKGDVDA